jgi:hypothetical protein
MTKAVINIGVDVEDTYFNFPQQVMCDIVDALHKNDTVEIHFAEGVALEELNYKEKKFLQILKELCERNRWPLEKIHFVLPNFVQDSSVWPCIEFGHSGQVCPSLEDNFFLKMQTEDIKINKNVNSTFGMFVGRSSWDRLLLGSHLYNKHKDKTIQTYRTYLDNPSNMLHIDINRLLWQISSYNNKTLSTANVIDSTAHFIKNLPLLLDDNHQGVTHIHWNCGAIGNDIISWYNNIFIDVVCEKMVTGQTFFPTEKTARPLATKTPFLIMASPNYIKNLHKLGFRSFSRFWDESYDYQQGVQRVHSIQSIIDNLAKLDNGKLKDMYQQMSPILEHNHKIYHELTGNDIASKFL